MKPREVKALTLFEFNMMGDGYHSRLEEYWDMTRNIMTFIANFAGKIVKTEVNPTELIPLKKDQAYQVLPIRTHAQAMELLETF